MISLYLGTPGSGKSLYAAKLIREVTSSGKNVICNFAISSDFCNYDKVTFFSNYDLSPDLLYKYSFDNHVPGKESQTLIVFDECQLLFNARDYKHKDRLSWLEFFAQHRKLGFDIVLVTQQDVSIDKQLRNLVEVRVNFLKLNYFHFFKWLPFTLIFCTQRHYLTKTAKQSWFYFYSAKDAAIYDTFYLFERV